MKEGKLKGKVMKITLEWIMVLLVCKMILPVSHAENDPTYFRFETTTTTLKVTLINKLPYGTSEVKLLLNSNMLQIVSSGLYTGAVLYQFRGLTPGSRQDLQIRLYDSRGTFLQMFQQVIVTEPSPPTDLSLYSLDNITALITWRPGFGQTGFYVITLSEPASFLPPVQAQMEGSGQIVGHVFSGLDPRKRYKISVSAHSGGKQGLGVTHIMSSRLSTYEKIQGKLYPKSGHKTGATNITLQYTGLDYLPFSTSLYFYNQDTQTTLPCITSFRHKDLVSCETRALTFREEVNLLGRPLSVHLSVYHGLTNSRYNISVDGAQFTYKGDPDLQSIYPQHTATSGGVALTVRGSNLDVLHDPKLILTPECSEGDIVKIYAPCDIEVSGGSEADLVCTTPDLTSYLDSSTCRPSRNKPITTSVTMDTKYGPIGVPDVVDLRIHQCPIIQMFENDVQSFKPAWHYNQKYIKIEGEGFDAFPAEMYSVLIGGSGATCRVLEVTTDYIKCRPPIPIMKPKPPGLIVQVKIGESGCAMFVGYLEYWQLFDDPVVQILVGGISGLAFLIILFFIIHQMCTDCIKAHKAKKKAEDLFPLQRVI